MQNFYDDMLNASGIIRHYLHPPTACRRCAAEILAEETEQLKRPKQLKQPKQTKQPQRTQQPSNTTTNGENVSRQGCLHHKTTTKTAKLTERPTTKTTNNQNNQNGVHGQDAHATHGRDARDTNNTATAYRRDACITNGTRIYDACFFPLDSGWDLS